MWAMGRDRFPLDERDARGRDVVAVALAGGGVRDEGGRPVGVWRGARVGCALPAVSMPARVARKLSGARECGAVRLSLVGVSGRSSRGWGVSEATMTLWALIPLGCLLGRRWCLGVCFPGARSRNVET